MTAIIQVFIMTHIVLLDTSCVLSVTYYIIVDTIPYFIDDRIRGQRRKVTWPWSKANRWVDSGYKSMLFQLYIASVSTGLLKEAALLTVVNVRNILRGTKKGIKQ